MSVIMIAEIAGADASFIDGMRAAGVVDAIATYPGFVSHISGAASSGYRVIEVWESRETHQSWVENVILPNMPPDAAPPTIEYIDLLAAVPES
jgi:heme-degrading monooxygenase HmoA